MEVSSTRLHSWTLAFFLIYKNDLAKVINNRSTPVLFANDTSILFSHSNFKGFEEILILYLKL